MTEFEKDSELGAIFERWGNAVARRAAKRRRRDLGLARPSEWPYIGHAPQVVQATVALTARKNGDRDLPEPKPERAIDLDAERGKRLKKYMDEAKPMHFVQDSLPFFSEAAE